MDTQMMTWDAPKKHSRRAAKQSAKENRARVRRWAKESKPVMTLQGSLAFWGRRDRVHVWDDRIANERTGEVFPITSDIRVRTEVQEARHSGPASVKKAVVEGPGFRWDLNNFAQWTSGSRKVRKANRLIQSLASRSK